MKDVKLAYIGKASLLSTWNLFRLRARLTYRLWTRRPHCFTVANPYPLTNHPPGEYWCLADPEKFA